VGELGNFELHNKITVIYSLLNGLCYQVARNIYTNC
jgi:hypothetical protein